jgi:hypothetical protein
MFAVPGRERDMSASRGLVAPQSRDPARGACERLVERADLAHVAAGLARVDRLAKAHDAVARDEHLHVVGVGKDDADVEAVAQLARVQRFERLRKVPPGVEREHVERPACLCNGVQHGLILEAEAGRERDPARDGVRDGDEAVLERRQAAESSIEPRRKRRPIDG